MKEYTKKSENTHLILDKKSRIPIQVPINEILQRYTNHNLQPYFSEGFNINNKEFLQTQSEEQSHIKDVLQRHKESSMQRFTSQKRNNSAPSIKPIQRIISVAGFQAATPAVLFHGRGPHIVALDIALATYIGQRSIANVTALMNACTIYLAGNHQPARMAAVYALRAEANAERLLLTQIGDANSHLIDALIAQIGIGGFALNNLVQLATQVGNAHANVLPNLINIVTPANLHILVGSNIIPAIGAANTHLLPQLIPLANGIAGIHTLTNLINASGGGANIPLLAPMIPLIGGHTQIPTLTAMLLAQGRQANQAFDLARVSGGNGGDFARLCGELPHFQRTAAAGVAAPLSAAEQGHYNAARVAAPLVQLNTLHNQAVLARNAVLPPNGIPGGFLTNLNNQITAVHTDIVNIGGGAPIVAAHQNHALQLKNMINILNNQVVGWGFAASPPAVVAAAVATTNALNAFNAAMNALNITQISFDHFLTRHTAHYFNFGEIKPDNTQWPTAWGNTASNNVDTQLAAVLTALHNAGNWLRPGNPLINQPVAGGTAQIAGLLGAGGGLRLGQFFPEVGANFYDHNAATMRAIDQLV